MIMRPTSDGVGSSGEGGRAGGEGDGAGPEYRRRYLHRRGRHGHGEQRPGVHGRRFELKISKLARYLKHLV